LLGGIRQWTGSYGPAFLLMAIISGEAAGLLALASCDWERKFLARGEQSSTRLATEGA
jgi:hypothetical protein